MRDAERMLAAPIEAEFSTARLGDERRKRRLEHVARSAMHAPQMGFPQMVASDAELEGIYRLLSNEDVRAEDVLAPHISATFDRMQSGGECLVVHDTTDFVFRGHSRRDGLGMMWGDEQQGFLAHIAFAVMRGEARLPLGVCALEHVRRFARTGANHGMERQSDPDRESLRWERGLRAVEARRDGFSCVHVMDREADIYDVLALATELGARFVIRVTHDRALAEEGRVFDRLNSLEPAVQMKIELTARRDRGRPLAVRKRNPARDGRTAYVALGACRMTLKSPARAHSSLRELSVNVVRVWEPKPPAGQPAMEWRLYTSEPISTPEQMLAVVDAYRSRWVIEEFFKALKTGCSMEKRQLESFHALANALALFIPIAWKMLLARSLCRHAPDAPAATLLTDVQMKLLVHRLQLQRPPESAEEATYVVAKLGGHLRRNGLPGWLTLGRGFEALLLMQAGWNAAVAAQRCDR